MLNIIRNIRLYFYSLLFGYLSIHARQNHAGHRIDPVGPSESMLANTVVLIRNPEVSKRYKGFRQSDSFEEVKAYTPDYILLNGNIHYERDIHSFLKQIHAVCRPGTRLIITYYSRLWQPFFRLATMLGLRSKAPEETWLATEHVQSILELRDFEPGIDESRGLRPRDIP